MKIVDKIAGFCLITAFLLALSCSSGPHKVVAKTESFNDANNNLTVTINAPDEKKCQNKLGQNKKRR
jgi:hypothetical protein